MEIAKVIQDIKRGEFAPVYLLHGEEPYFTDKITEAILAHALSAEQREFDQSVLYGRDTDVKDLVSTVKRFPMTGPRHVVVLREAQDLKKPEMLEALFENPVSTTVFVLAFKKKVDMRKKWAKLASKSGVTYTAAKIPEWKMTEWVRAEAKSKGVEMDSKSASMLVEFLGDDLQKISKDLDKLHMLSRQGHAIGPALIQKVIGVSRDYNMFELQDALLTKNHLKAQTIVKYFAADPRTHSIQQMIGILFGMYSKLISIHATQARSPEAAAKAIGSRSTFYAKKLLSGAQKYTYGGLVRCISTLREYDMKSKGMGATNATEQGELMRELVFKLGH